MTVRGNIPTRIAFIYSKHRRKEGDIYPAFVSDAENPETMKTGLAWAADRFWDHSIPGYSSIGRGKAEVLTVANEPFENVTITSLEVRGKGGRAYKVNVPVGDFIFHVDLREDQLLNAVLEYGVRAGGILNGSFIFSMVEGQMKLILFNSKVYHELVESTVNKKLKRIPVRELIPGHVYKGRESNRLYIGRASSFKLIDTPGSGGVVIIKNGFLWFENPLSLPDDTSIIKMLEDGDRLWYLKLTKSTSVREHVGPWTDEADKEDWNMTVEAVRNAVRAGLETKVKAALEHRGHVMQPDSWEFVKNQQFIDMKPGKADITIPENVQNYVDNAGRRLRGW